MPALSEPIQVKGLRLANRIVMAPVSTGFAEGHRASPDQVAWYRDHALLGPGLVIVEAAAVQPDAVLNARSLGLWEDAQVPGLARIAQAIKGAGVPAVLQLVHGGARSHREDPGAERVGPSPVALVPGPAPRELTEAELHEIIRAFAGAAARAARAGFDGVEIHAAHYYLLSQFLSPRSNQRTDRWGGSLENRCRLGLEVVRAAVGPDFALFCRLNGQEFLEGGFSTEEAIVVAQALEQAGVDLIDASGVGSSSLGDWEGQPVLTTSSTPAKDAPGGIFAASAQRIRQAVGIPVITVGKLSEPGVAQGILDRGQADLVALGRPLVADFQVARKLLEGRDAEILRCKECLSCFKAIRLGPIHCSVNTEL